jgi:hypothetical protein
VSHQSIEAARMIRDHLTSFSHPSIKKVELLEPHHENHDWANAALVVHLEDGTRYGMEVCPFPTIPAMPTDRLRTMSTEPEPQDPSTVQAPDDEPPVPTEPPYENPV